MKFISLHKCGSRGTRADLGVCPTMVPEDPILQKTQWHWAANLPHITPAILACDHAYERHSSMRLATSAVHPVWWLAPMPAPLSPWKCS